MELRESEGKGMMEVTWRGIRRSENASGECRAKHLPHQSKQQLLPPCREIEKDEKDRERPEERLNHEKIMTTMRKSDGTYCIAKKKLLLYLEGRVLSRS